VGCTSGSPFQSSDSGTVGTDGVSAAETATSPDTPSAPPPAADAVVEAVIDREWKQSALALIGAAKQDLYLFHFELHETGSVTQVRYALEAAASRGVKVRVLLDDDVDGNAAAVALLGELGIEAKLDHHSTRMHLKTLLSDGAVLLGSTNLSGASIDFNHETNVLVRDPEAVAWIRAHLDALWADTGFVGSPTSGGSSQVTVWRDKGYEAVALDALNQATSAIDVVVYGINLDPKFPDGPVAHLADALYAAVDRGVPVRMLLEASGWDNGLTELNEEAAGQLVAGGVSVRFDSTDVTTHAKLVVADGTALVGSNNWSFSGLELAHELGVAFTEPAAVLELSTWFDERWTEATPFIP
jgi:phosphatidylserine/phosphatidylglycerophosphate/cardiolipin synthase-like enzyme